MSLFHSSADGNTPGRKFRKSGKSPASKAAHKARLGVEMLEDRSIPSASTISGYVYHDLSNAGVPNPSDPPIANAVVELTQVRNGQTVIVASTTSNATGYYQFNADQTIDTSPQTISQTVTFAPTSTDFSLSNAINAFDSNLGTLQSVQITNDSSITSDIQVENTSTSSPSKISATVAGSLTLTGPIGMTNLVTNLQQAAGTFNATSFDGTLDFGGTSGTDFGPQTASGSQSETLTGSALDQFIIAGGGNVTLTEDGVATSAAKGGGNLVVGISSTGQAQVTVVYTYTPTNALQPGNYTIDELTTPAGMVPGQVSSNGVILPNPPGDEVIPVTLVNNNSINNDFAFLTPGTISGTVFLDKNNNGIQDPGDPGISGVTLQLTGTDFDGNPISATAVTGVTGQYQFVNLTPGNYTVTEVPPTNYLQGIDDCGSLGGVSGIDVESNIQMPTGGQGVGYNFAHVQASSLSGYVFIETTTAGINSGVFQSPEVGLGNVTVTLTGTNDLGTAVTATQVTNSAGYYNFTGLLPGNYVITKTPVSAYLDGKTTVGSQGGTQTTDVISKIVLGPNVTGVNNNFGELTRPISGGGGGGGGTPTETILNMAPPTFTTPAIPIISKLQLMLPPSNPFNVTIKTDVQLIEAYTSSILNRNATSAEVTSWLKYLVLDGGTIAGMINSMWNSDEHHTDEIVTMYKSIFGSGPSQGTVNTYLNLFHAGQSECQVLTAMLASSQTQQMVGNTTNYIILLYRVAQGTTPTTAQLASLLAQKLTPTQMANSVFGAAASRQALITQTFEAVFGRAPTSSEVSTWTSLLNSGVTYGAFVMNLLGSGSFTTRV
jgi:hypothetical protein